MGARPSRGARLSRLAADRRRPSPVKRPTRREPAVVAPLGSSGATPQASMRCTRLIAGRQWIGAGPQPRLGAHRVLRRAQLDFCRALTGIDAGAVWRGRSREARALLPGRRGLLKPRVREVLACASPWRTGMLSVHVMCAAPRERTSLRHLGPFRTRRAVDSDRATARIATFHVKHPARCGGRGRLERRVLDPGLNQRGGWPAWLLRPRLTIS